eukprot:5905274-Pyramimonas_sp.AAC.1
MAAYPTFCLVGGVGRNEWARDRLPAATCTAARELKLQRRGSICIVSVAMADTAPQPEAVEKSEKVLKREEEKRRKKAEKEAKEAAKKEKAAGPQAGPVTVKVIANPPIDLEPCPGTRDFYPEDMRLREWLFGHFNAVAQL